MLRLFKRFIYQNCLIFVIFVFCVVQIENLGLLPLGDEPAYINPILLDCGWSFFLPWNYDPRHFMGHPMGQPLILWVVFKLFGADMLIVKAVSLGFSALCLWTLYRMVECLFKDQWIAFVSAVFTVFYPFFYEHSTRALTEIPLMAFGFWSVYAFQADKYKTLLLVSCALALIRESSLAFLCPLVLTALFSHRKAFLYLIPSLLLFFSHFFIFWLKTGRWSAHPHAYGELPHNPNPVFFEFSEGIDRLHRLFIYFLESYPSSWFLYLFFFSFIFFLAVWIKKKVFKVSFFQNSSFLQEILKLSFIGFLFKALNIVRFENSGFLKREAPKKPDQCKKAERGVFYHLFHDTLRGLFFTVFNVNLSKVFQYERRPFLLKNTFIPLAVSVLFLGFYVSWAEGSFKNVIPCIVLTVPLAVYFMSMVFPLSRFLLVIVFCSLFLKQTFPEKFFTKDRKFRTGPERIERYKRRSSEAQALALYLETEYGRSIRRNGGWIYAPYPYSSVMRHPLYGYVKHSYSEDHYRFFEAPKRYALVVLKKEFKLPYNKRVYNFLISGNSFIRTPLPEELKKFVLFVHLRAVK